MPSNWQNIIWLKKEGFNKSDEYLIMPYTRFTLERTPDKFKYIDEGILDLEKEEKVREAKQYEMILSKSKFYKDKVKAKWWKIILEDIIGYDSE